MFLAMAVFQVCHSRERENGYLNLPPLSADSLAIKSKQVCLQLLTYVSLNTNVETTKACEFYAIASAPSTNSTAFPLKGVISISYIFTVPEFFGNTVLIKAKQANTEDTFITGTCEVF